MRFCTMWGLGAGLARASTVKRAAKAGIPSSSHQASRRDHLESWDIRSLDVAPHHPRILRSDEESRVIAINLPGGEELQDHQVHERAYVVVLDGEVEIVQDGQG